MKNVWGLNVLFVLFLLIGINTAEACDCAGRPQGVRGVQTCGYYWYSENVFIGLAEKVEIDRGAMKVTFAVEKPIRGSLEKTVEVYTSASEASCGYPFKQGERYFVYAGKSSNGKLSESLCGPTTLLKDAEDDLEYVKDLESGKLGTRIFGQVSEDRQATLKDQRVFEPLANIEITIKGKKKRFKTVTDEKGFYLFKEVPPDIYRVTAKFPSGLREIAASDDLLDHYASIYRDSVRCDGESFVATRQGSIRGKVANFTGEGIKNPWSPDAAQPKVSLFPLDENNQIIPYRAPVERWAYRDKFEFFFNTVPAGNYLLVINPNNCPYPNNGMPTMYFPGVASRSEAKIITVKEGEQLVLEDFRALPNLPERWFSGVALTTDKTPAANATIRLLDANMNKCSNMHLEVKTDESGRFRLKGFETYEYKIEAYAEEKTGQRQSYAKPFIISQAGNVEEIVLVLDQSF